MFNLGEFFDGPYNKFLPINILETRRVHDKFHACFLILIKFHELYWYFYLKVCIWNKGESPSHTRRVRPN
jgi:hypothetical protein